MPILHIQCEGTALGSDGKQIPLPGSQLLAFRGPVVPVVIRPPPQIIAALTKAGSPLPAAVAGFGLIDTGASSSCIDDTVAQNLNLPIVNVIKMASATHSEVERNVYPIVFDIVGGVAITVNSPRTAGAELKNQGLVLLIGRDLLGGAQFIYNGMIGSFSIAF